MRRVYLDSCMVIYLLENTGSFSVAAKQFLVKNSDAILCVSPLVRMEVLVKPLRDAASALVADYEDFIAAQNWLAIDDGIVASALQLRVKHGLKTPDALHLATAMHYGCNEFWTNDDRLNKVATDLAVNVFSR
ncbi:MAG: PIN domain-containing protein [Gallionella sp.]